MATNFNVRKIYITAERIDGCWHFLEIIITPLEERITENNFFLNKHTIAERIAETMDDCKIYRQNKHSIL